jgi:hypothetical protein
MARIIDLCGHSLAGFGQTDELVAQEPSKTHVTLGDLEVGVADSDGFDLETNFSREWLWDRTVAFQVNPGPVAEDASHGFCLLLGIFIWDGLSPGSRPHDFHKSGLALDLGIDYDNRPSRCQRQSVASLADFSMESGNRGERASCPTVP